MAWTKANLTRMWAAMSLLFAVFVITPAVAQLSCIPGQPAPAVEAVQRDQAVQAYQAYDVADSSGSEHIDTASSHDLCALEHCNHNVSIRSAPLGEFRVNLVSRADQELPIEDFRTSFSPDGLKRPPRG